ncbi:cadmium ion transporter [Kwoniella mangroviensis CBS 10435]|uniref:Cadmium ion transporter n=1 Tax=Kwoniella mangroviensis CBS 10435 TaxID=1331196 RepID=A0A1B9ISB0_9TREE|nr:cadmium ion transporter [Kwoniella mangroviensis CBS 10435]
MPIPFYRPLPAIPGIYGSQTLPEQKANILSRIVFHWVTPIMRAGYSRPLEAEDLWMLTSDLECKNIADQLQSHLDKQSDSRETLRHTSDNEKVSANGKMKSSNVRDSIALIDTLDGYSIQNPSVKLEPTYPTNSRFGRQTSNDDYKNDPDMSSGSAHQLRNSKSGQGSLLKAMYMTVWSQWWKAVICKGCAAGLQITAPLVTRLLIDQLILSHDNQQNPSAKPPRSVGYMIGLAFALFVMVQCASLFSYQALQRGNVVGFMMRAALIDLIGRKSMRLSSTSKIEFTSGKLTTMVSADASFLDFSAPMTLDLVVQPIQIAVGLGLLIWTLGYSALVGLAVIDLNKPIYTYIVAYMFTRMIHTRQSQLQYVDSRVRLLSETISSIRSVKLFAYVQFFSNKVNDMRKNELIYLRKNGFNRATMNATMAVIPTLAAVLTFVTYGLTRHELNAAIIFSGLQYFNVLKTPISFLSMCFTAVSDALVGIHRIGALLRSEEISPKLNINHQSEYALDVRGDFQFESLSESNDKPQCGSEPGKEENDEKDPERSSIKSIEPFALRNIDLKIPRGALVCIVGKVGTGKSALLSSLIGDMRQLDGHTVFGGLVSYVPQQAWIHSGSIRDNITFSATSKEIDFGRFGNVIDACALRSDIDAMNHGDLTNVGEKGLLLSGGQRQRLSLARAAYSHSDVVLLDDPLSAVDANVSHHILKECILGELMRGRTRLIVTHQTAILPRADLVLVMDRNSEGEGKIVQQGNYHDLKMQEGPFRSFISDHTSDRSVSTPTLKPANPESSTASDKDSKKDKASGVNTMEEDRQIGSIPWSVYITYFRSMGTLLWPITFGSMLLLTQAATVGNSLWLGWWSGDKFEGLGQGGYMGIYGVIGTDDVWSQWGASYTMFVAGLKASYRLFEQAWERVMRAPVRWHDQTPSGRIINRLSKGNSIFNYTLDTSISILLTELRSAVGTFGLILYTYPWLGIAFIPLCLFYWLCGGYYRQTSREVKRIDSITRSQIYSSFGEQLAGLSVIRAFGKQDTFKERMQNAINVEGVITSLTIFIRWLGVRLDLSSNLLILLIAIFGISFRNSVDPASFGVVFSYALAAAQLFSNLVSLYAQVELEMNNAERILHYTTLPSEPPPYTSQDPPSGTWPTEGEIIFKNVSLRYSENGPWVLKKLNFHIEAGEKIGVIGRTGAGKSSLVGAIMGMNDIKGEIRVDGLNLKGIGIDTVRERIGIIPQDAFLFEGTIRQNLDPLSIHSDHYLNSLLSLIHSDPLLPSSQSTKDKFKLDSQVSSEGANFSAGEKQLLALIRALARNTKILLLDEATSSVDPETDALIQRIIQNHLNGVTLISIAHRLQTVAYYDRILVLDQGRVVEYDTPLGLYDIRDSIFRQLCDRVQLGRTDLLRLRHDALYALQASRDDKSLFNHYSIAEAWVQNGGVRVSEYRS